MNITQIDSQTKRNKKYRKVVYTDSQMQLVIMCVPASKSIPYEVHKHTTQFTKIVEGRCSVTMDGGKGKRYVKAGASIIIPNGTRHLITNTSKTKPLKLYSVYARPESV